jgi:hypothetical protein
MSTPGSPLVWCFGPGGEADLTVTVDNGSLWVHVARTGQDVALTSTSELVAWLQQHRSDALRDQTSRVLDKVRGGKLFRWN